MRAQENLRGRKGFCLRKFSILGVQQRTAGTADGRLGWVGASRRRLIALRVERVGSPLPTHPLAVASEGVRKRAVLFWRSCARFPALFALVHAR